MKYKSHGTTPLDEVYTWNELYERVCNRLPKLKTIKGFKSFFMSNEKNGYLFDPILIGRAFRMQQDMLAKDRDHFTLVFGKEGGGKSTLSAQLGSWIDPNFSYKNFCWTPQDYFKRLKEVKKGSCLVLDEGGTALYSRTALSLDNISMTKLFMLQRQKNVSVIVCCPDYWSIDSYIRRHRINTLIRIIGQGSYCGYLQKSIDCINEVTRKRPITQIRCPNGQFWHGKFRKPFPKSIDRDKYIEYKAKHLENFMDELQQEMEGPKMLQASKVAKELGMKAEQMSKRILRGSIKATKIGKLWYIGREEYGRLLGEIAK